MNTLTYLASPYSHPDPAVRHARFKAACRVAGGMLQKSRFVHSPIAHTHSIAELCDLPKGFDFWAAYDERLLWACDDMIVLMLPGWEDSLGVQAEIQMAEQMGMLVTYLTPEEAGL